MHYPNIHSLFTDRVGQFRARANEQSRNAFYFRGGDQWHGISWDRFDLEVHHFATALVAMGLQPGAAVAILMGNVPEWPISDLGTIIAGGVGVGLYPTSSAEQCEYIINHADAEFVLLDSPAQLEKVLSFRDRLPKVKAIIVLDEFVASQVNSVISYRNFIARGQEAREQFRPVLAERAAATKPDDTAIMVYTSGTTGAPKGACLSHRYIINSVESLRQTIPINSDDVSFSYLPFCHVAERISGLYNRLYAGASAYFVDDLTRLGEYMTKVKPTVFASLPRFFEKIHTRAIADVELLPADAREEFQQALELGREVSRLRQDRKPVSPELQQRYSRFAVPVLTRIKQYFGGRIRVATSGGAPLLPEVAEFFDAAGLPILQAYGLTENVCVAFNRPDNYKFGTVGPAMPGCEIEIAADGEILVRSEMMFSGYYKDPELTREGFREGWLLTGDLGELDNDGFLTITGRKKELIVTSTGKKVAPAMLENMLKEHHLISQAMVFGEGKSYLVALVTLNLIEAGEYASTHGLASQSDGPVANSIELNQLVAQLIAQVNARVSSTESIKRFAILDRDLEIERDEITPTGKLKRDVVTANFRSVIEALYKQEESR